ncbi:LysM peptidoglycan-binding domain-containing protein [Patescibacteria group bacterium]|nr:MAG: LysM peptidoglycan-binding domain-containing protein [Patescibacteria group bacterium]
MAHRRKRARGVPKASTVAIYASIFAVIVAVVAVGYHAPQETSGVANASPATTDTQTQSAAIDQVVATNVAANLAETTNLSVAPNVIESAVSAQTQSDFLQSDTTVITKPQILQPGAENRSITSYTVKAGDTADSVAAQYGLSVNTIEWANNLSSSALKPGTVLTVLPTDGVLYTVKSGDTLQSISDKYSVDQTRVILYNDLADANAVTAGLKLILPGANLPTNERPGYVAPLAATTAFFTGYSSGFDGNTWHIKNGTPNNGNYAAGNCTAYAYDRRMELGLPVGKNWGNAGSWAYNAANGIGVAQKLRVDHTPSIGAVMQDSGHVAIVENILPNGDVQVSEMNAYVSGGGWNIVSGRNVPAAYVGQYLYIH